MKSLLSEKGLYMFAFTLTQLQVELAHFSGLLGLFTGASLSLSAHTVLAYVFFKTLNVLF